MGTRLNGKVAMRRTEVGGGEVNESGQFSPSQPHWNPPQVPVPEVIGDLPAFCDIRIHQRTPRSRD